MERLAPWCLSVLLATSVAFAQKESNVGIAGDEPTYTAFVEDFSRGEPLEHVRIEAPIPQKAPGGLLLSAPAGQPIRVYVPADLTRMKRAEIEFTIRTPASENLWYGVGVRWGDRDYQSIMLAAGKGKSHLRYHGTESRYYGMAPLWRAGQRYVAGFELDLNTIQAVFNPAGADKDVYRLHVRPETLGEGEFYFEITRDQETEGVREVLVHRVAVEYWDPAQLKRLRQKRDRKRTEWERRSKEILAWRRRIKDKPKVRVQFWDASKSSWEQWALIEMAARGDYVQSRGFGAEALEKIKTAGLYPALYLIPRSPHRSFDPSGTLMDSYAECYWLDKDYIGAAAGWCREVVEGVMKSQPERMRLMLDSESRGRLVQQWDREAQPGYETRPLVRHLAAEAGVLPLDADAPALWGKRYLSAGEPRGIIPNVDPAFALSRWWYNQASWIPLHTTVASIVREKFPDVEVTTDPIMDRGAIGQFRNLQLVQHWVRVHRDSRDPLSVPWWIERARVHRREGKQNICVGPQLKAGSGLICPPEMLTEACWLAVGFGATDITHWGYHAIHEAQFSYHPGGEALWNALERLNRELYVKHGELALSWEPQARRTAIWLSQADCMHHGKGMYSFGRAVEEVENLFRAVMSLGEPLDVVYDEEVERGRLERYEYLILPAMGTLTQAQAKRLQAFVDGGGKVAALEGFSLPVKGVPTVKVAENPVLPKPSFRKWRHETARAVADALKLTPRVQMDSMNVVANLMESDGKKYLVLINDHRNPRAEDDYKRAPEGKGLPVTVQVKLDGVTKVTCQDSGEVIPVENGTFTVEITPGWGRILRYE